MTTTIRILTAATVLLVLIGATALWTSTRTMNPAAADTDIVLDALPVLGSDPAGGPTTTPGGAQPPAAPSGPGGTQGAGGGQGMPEGPTEAGDDPTDVDDPADPSDPDDPGQPPVGPGLPDGDILIGEIDPDPGPGVTPGLLAEDVDGFLARPPSGEVQVPLGATDLKAGPGCAVQCITGGTAVARGVGAKLTVTTDTPATIWLVATDGAASTVVRQSPGATTSFSTLLEDLEAGTTYDVTVAATDGDGHTAHAYGSFTTLRRTAVVSFTHAELLSSSSSASSADAHVRVDGSWLESAWSVPLDGSFVGLGINWIELEDADRMLDLFFQLAQHNGDDVCEPASWYFPAAGGSGTVTPACRIYSSTGGVPIDLDARPADATSWTQHTFQLVLGSHPQPLAFQVPVTIHVTYS